MPGPDTPAPLGPSLGGAMFAVGLSTADGAVLDDTDAHIAALQAEVFRRAMQAGMVRSELAMLSRDAPEHGPLADVLHRLESSVSFLEGLITACRLLQRSAGARSAPARRTRGSAPSGASPLPTAVTRVARHPAPTTVRPDPHPPRPSPPTRPARPSGT
ncbi:hypothetical protein [Marinactinospora rubrisoli]|uniref:HPt domain-containing protein n=1 Tax=Marinactinospora rubrisoli TaxID=2715399 RepID=A0ABW2KMJ2_9ACTN